MLVSESTGERLAELFLSTVAMVNDGVGAPLMSVFYSHGART